MTKRATGTKEWAAHSHNITNGCEHGCVYCYARTAAIRKGRRTPENWMDPEPIHGNIQWRRGLKSGTVMFPTQHDITPANVDDAVKTLKGMLKAGNDVLIVSKPHLNVIRRFCLDLEPWKDQILFRFTIGAVDDEILSLWEPGAPLFRERFACLRLALGAGFATSVSMEPLLETEEDDIVEMVEILSFWVTDSIWIGKANLLTERLRENGFDTPEHMVPAGELLGSQTNSRILSLYERLKNHPKVKWKDSIKTVVGIATPDEAGLDI